MKMKLMKVFNCTEMPEDITKAFFKTMSGRFCNDCYVDWFLEDDLETEDVKIDGYTPEHRMVTKWLFKNGATQDDAKVLIKHWW